MILIISVLQDTGRRNPSVITPYTSARFEHNLPYIASQTRSITQRHRITGKGSTPAWMC